MKTVTIPKRVVDHVHKPEYTSANLLEWCEAIEGEGRGVTVWEKNFVEDCRIKLEKRWQLSDRQIETLEKIYTERT